MLPTVERKRKRSLPRGSVDRFSAFAGELGGFSDGDFGRSLTTPDSWFCRENATMPKRNPEVMLSDLLSDRT